MVRVLLCDALGVGVNLVPLWNEIDVMARFERGACFGREREFSWPGSTGDNTSSLFNTSIGFVTFRRIGPLVVHGCAIQMEAQRPLNRTVNLG